MYYQKKLVYKIIILLLCLVIVSACEGSIGVSKRSISEKKDIEKLTETKKYNEIQEFISGNLQDIENRHLVEFAISSLIQSKDIESLSFLKKTFQKLVKNEKWDSINGLIDSLENKYNQETINNVREEIDIYQDSRTIIKELEIEKESLIQKKNKLEQEYPYEIMWSDTPIYEFYGSILQKINENEYRVIQNHTNSNKQYVLKTFQSSYTSTGNFGMHVIPGEEEKFHLQNGFTEDFLTLYEIPEEHLDLANQIINTRIDINRISNEIDNYKVEHNKNSIEMFMEDIFKMIESKRSIDKSNETNKKNNDSSVFHVTDNKLYIRGVTLGDKKSMVIEKLGTPDEEKVDDSDYEPVDTVLIYDSLKIYILKNKIKSLILDTNKEFFEKNFSNHYSGEKYVSQDGGIYFYESKNEHLLFTKEYEEKFIVYLNYVDENFKYYVEDGWIQRLN